MFRSTADKYRLQRQSNDLNFEFKKKDLKAKHAVALNSASQIKLRIQEIDAFIVKLTALDPNTSNLQSREFTTSYFNVLIQAQAVRNTLFSAEKSGGTLDQYLKDSSHNNVASIITKKEFFLKKLDQIRLKELIKLEELEQPYRNDLKKLKQKIRKGKTKLPPIPVVESKSTASPHLFRQAATFTLNPQRHEEKAFNKQRAHRDLNRLAGAGRAVLRG